MTSLDFPLRHLSIRVPWHDSGWTGVVCQAPHLNGACAKLSRIAEKKKAEDEKAIAGRSLEDLSREQWPCCVEERATFMAPFELVQVKHHALKEVNREHYGHFKPTQQRYPAYSAGVVPYLWLTREKMESYRNLLGLDVDDDREPDLGYETTWVHEARNQKALLDGFAAHLREEESLTLFYAKHVPFVEGTGRILIGAGRIKQIGNLTEYERSGDGMRGMVWERPVQHTIRPKGKDGFLMPYYDILRRAEEDPSLDIERYTAKAPDEHWGEFSYASELVTHDGAIGALLSMDVALGRIEAELSIAVGWQRKWIHDELIRLWKVRGPFPGLGAVLSAFGLSRGIFLAHALQQLAGENADPWPHVDASFSDPTTLPQELRRDIKELAPTWKGLAPGRRAYLRLLSRFELSKDQAEALYDDGSRRQRGWGGSDRDILQNPYRIFELSRHGQDGIRLLTVDRGVFPEDTVRLQHPLEEPSRLDSAVDLRRVRAFCVASLEDAALNGHTLRPKDQVVEAIVSRPVRPACSVTGDIIGARATELGPEVCPVPLEDSVALQLDRYTKIGDLVRKQVQGRVGGQRHIVKCDWAQLVREKFGPVADAEEEAARTEKAAALNELAEARLSVLVGPAGAGKTTVLGILCSRPEIRAEGLLLLAPTGKARVRMQELADSGGAKALTIAQFLNQNGRYVRISGFSTGDFARIRQAISLQSGTLLRRVLGARLDVSLLTGDPILSSSLTATTFH